MGGIFLARASSGPLQDKLIAIKRILPHLTHDPKYVEQFLNEARVQAQINHSCIVQIFELGQAEDGSYFLAMEYVHGKSLAQLIGRANKLRERIPPALVAIIHARIAEGLAYTHRKKDSAGRSMHVIHRDVSPQNVLISYTGDVKLIDFGVAKSNFSESTLGGMIKGKYVYMSPEQSAGKKIDLRSDIFSLGLVLYESLAGRNPFHRANVVHALEAIQRWNPPPVSSSDVRLAPFDPILAKAMAKNPAARYQDAAELEEALFELRKPRTLPFCGEQLHEYVQRMFRDKLEAETRALVESDKSALDKVSHSARLQLGIGPDGKLQTPVAPLTANAAQGRGSGEIRVVERFDDDEEEDEDDDEAARAGADDGPATKAIKPSPGSTPKPRAPVAGGELASVEVNLDDLEGQPSTADQTQVVRVDGEGEHYTIASGTPVQLADIAQLPNYMTESEPTRVAPPTPSMLAAAARSQALEEDDAQVTDEPTGRADAALVEALARSSAESVGSVITKVGLPPEADGAAPRGVDLDVDEATRPKHDPATAATHTLPAMSPFWGWLTVRPLPPTPVTHNRKPVSGKLELVDMSGTVEFGRAPEPFHVVLRYARTGGGTVVIDANPAAAVQIGGAPLGSTPTGPQPMTSGPLEVELKKAGADKPMRFVVELEKPA